MAILGITGSVSLGVVTLIWFYLIVTLFKRLKHNHHDTFVEMGEPALFWNNSLNTTYLFMKFLFGRKYKELGDEKLTRHCLLMFWVFWLDAVILVITIIANFSAQAQIG